jgi:hypothetical protein
MFSLFLLDKNKDTNIRNVPTTFCMHFFKLCALIYWQECLSNSAVFRILSFLSPQELAHVRDEKMIAHMLMMLRKYLPKSKFFCVPTKFPMMLLVCSSSHSSWYHTRIVHMYIVFDISLRQNLAFLIMTSYDYVFF